MMILTGLRRRPFFFYDYPDRAKKLAPRDFGPLFATGQIDRVRLKKRDTLKFRVIIFS